MIYVVCLAYGHWWQHIGGLMLQGSIQEDAYDCRCDAKRYEQWHVRTRKTVRQRWTRPDSYKLGYRVTREDAKQYIRERGWEEVAATILAEQNQG